MRLMKARRGGLPALVLAVALVATACGSSAASEVLDVASLTDGATDNGQVGSDPAVSAEESALAFAQCMRDGGIDFPDPTVDENGDPSFQGAFGAGAAGSFNPRSEEFQTAAGVCTDLTGGAAFGGGGRRGGFDPGELQDALLPYTACLRDQDLDVGDISFGQPGVDGPGGGGQGGPAAGGAQGQRGPGGDRAGRIAAQLGFDSNDPAWISANEVCGPLLDEALAGFAPGGGGTNP